MIELSNFNEQNGDEWVVVDSASPDLVQNQWTATCQTMKRVVDMVRKIQSTWRENRYKFIEDKFATQFDDDRFPRSDTSTLKTLY